MSMEDTLLCISMTAFTCPSRDSLMMRFLNVWVSGSEKGYNPPYPAESK